MRDYLQLREVVDGRRRGGYADRMVIVPQDKRNLCLEKKRGKKKGKEREEWTRRKNAGKEKKTRRDRDARSKVNDGNFRDRRLVRVDAPTNGKTMRCKNRICTPASTVFDRRRVVDSPADYHGS